MKAINDIEMISLRKSPFAVYKKGFMVVFAAAALTLSACGTGTPENDNQALDFDSELSEAEAAAEIEEASAPMITDREDSPVLPSSDEPEGTGQIVGQYAEPDNDITGGVGSTTNPEMPDDQVAPVDREDALASTDDGLDNSAVLDDRDPEENVSTY